jgi:group I intron endonuclease
MKTSQFYIYLITNLLNSKVYIGKSINPAGRWHDHKKVALGSREKYPNDFFAIHAAVAKYGVDNFQIEIIDQFDNEENAYSAETVMILLSCSNLKNYGYNCNLGGEGGIVPNEETRQKLIAAQNRPERIKEKSDLMKKRHQDNPGFLSSVHKGNQYTKGKILTNEHKQNISDSLKGRIFSEEHKQKISEAVSGENHPMYGTHLSEERKQIISERMTGENNPFFGKQHSLETMIRISEKNATLIKGQVLEIRRLWETGDYCKKDIAKIYNVSDSNISHIINRKTWKHI